MSRPAVFYFLDTHALYWHLVAPHKLGAAAVCAFDEGGKGAASLIVSHVVLAELFYLFKKHGEESIYHPLLNQLEASPAYTIDALNLDDMRSLSNITDIPEMHDRLIAIQVPRLGAVNVTKDATIQASQHTRSIW